MNLFTVVKDDKMRTVISLKNSITVLGSCFADNVGNRLSSGGFDLLSNPFGTLYNPASIADAVDRLDSGKAFTAEDCVQIGAGSELICSHSHHTSFARATQQDFLEHANNVLIQACDFWGRSDRVIITLGTAFVWRLAETGKVVANCLKRPAELFTHEMLNVENCTCLLQGIVDRHPEKDFIFTVSPIRHLSMGAHSNTLSKATLHLAVSRLKADYFPAYEILLDELRDYRFYADDLTHPSKMAVECIWERFLQSAVPENEHTAIRANEKENRRKAHIQLPRR